MGLTCEICLYDCFQCTNATACSTCDNTTDFRQMNATTKRCSPLPGYYDDGLNKAIALACIANCNNCTTSTNCFGCAVPYYISAGTCIVNCSQAIGNCSTCSVSLATVLCDSCVLGFYTNITANNCSIICGDGILASTEACDDGNNVDGDGCSSLCII